MSSLYKCAICEFKNYSYHGPNQVCRHQRFEAMKSSAFLQKTLDEWKRVKGDPFAQQMVVHYEEKIAALESRTQEEIHQDNATIAQQHTLDQQYRDAACRCSIMPCACGSAERHQLLSARDD